MTKEYVSGLIRANRTFHGSYAKMPAPMAARADNKPRPHAHVIQRKSNPLTHHTRVPLQCSGSGTFTLSPSSQSTIAKNLGVDIGGGICTALVIAWLMYNKLNLASDFSGWLTHVGTTQSLGQRIINLFRSKYKDVDTRFVNQVKELFDKYSSSSYEGSHQIKTFEKDVLKDFGLTYDPSWVITTRSPFDLTSIDTILEHMEDSTNSYFMIRLRESATSGWGHRVGLIKAGGKYYFYDPNVGIYESSSLAGLKASLRDMFSKIPLYKSSSFWSVIPFAG